MEPGESAELSALRERAELIVASILRDDELEWVRTARSGGRVELRLSARGEQLSFLLAGGGTDVAAQLDHFAAALEDFVAESGFAWGQQRSVPHHLRRWPAE